MVNPQDAAHFAAKVNRIIESHTPVILFIGKRGHEVDALLTEKPWSCVVTSLQQESLLYDFTIENKRRVSPIEGYADMHEKAALSQRDLNIIYLHGREKTSQLLAGAKRRRDSEASNMLKLLPDLLKSNFGYLVITGYGEESDDEIDFASMFDTIEIMRKGSVYMFGVPDSLWENELFNDLLAEDRITAVSEDLSSLLREINATRKPGDEDLELAPAQNINDVYFYISGKRKKIGTDDLFETRGFVSLLSESEIGDTSYPSYLKTDYFYNFLRNSANAPVWYGYENKFNLKRYFEDNLKRTVENALEAGRDPDKNRPILLMGQTSSSKSMVLGHLAYSIYREQTYPVLYIKNPDVSLDREGTNFSALDALILRLEKLSARKVLLIWDNSSSFNHRRETAKLYTNLKNRGRKVVLVSSGYEYGNARNIGIFELVHADIELNSKERANLCELVLANSNISLKEYERWTRGVEVNNLLALLYNLLHDHLSEEIIRGVGREADYGMDSFFRRLDRVPSGSEKSALTNMALALQKVGYKISDFSSESDEVQQAEQLDNKIRDFFITVAVASQYKISLPVYMALRRMKLAMNNYFATVQGALLDVPCLRIFPVEQDESSFDYLISFRTPLEASLYLRSAGVTPDQEIRHIVELILDTSSSGIYSRYSETATIERLIRIIGPNSERRENIVKYQRYYLLIVKALSELRIKHKISELRLICQEVTWLREIYGNTRTEPEEISDAERKEKLQSAIQLANATLAAQQATTSKFNRNNLNNLTVERILCELRLYELSRKDVPDHYKSGISLTFNFRELYSQIKSSIASDPANMYQLNAMMNLFFCFYDNETVSFEEKFNYFSETVSVVEFVESQLGDVFNDDEYNGHILHLKQIESQSAYDVYFEELLKRGNAVGVYLKGRQLIENNGIDLKKEINPNQEEKVREVVELIKKYASATKSHSGCQYMLLRLTWLLYNRKPIFSGEEMQRTAMRDTEWSEIRAICQNYEQQFMRGTELPVNASTIYYILALSHAQLEDYRGSIDAFSQIEKNAKFYAPVRNKVWHLVCDENGNTKKFKGYLKEEFYDPIQRKGRIHTADLGNVYFYGPSLKLTKYTGAFGDFEIGTNYIGFEAFRKLEEEA